MKRWRTILRRLRPSVPRPRQGAFPFFERSSRRERRFKLTIVVATVLVMFGILQAFPWGRYLEASLETRTTGLARRAFGLTSSRAEIMRSWEDFRRLGIESVRPQVEQFYARSNPAFQKLLRYAGMDPDHGLIRWGNYNWTLLLSSKVFEADDRGRSYRLRPNVRSIWLRRLDYRAGAIAFYLVPDGPGLAEAIRGTTAIPVETSRQTTNSWGVRGPEPDPAAPLRILVLGDSYMEGMFVGDDETPPECLRRYLERTSGGRVSVLNTGVMGYSPEQYYAALLAFADRFQPQAVVVSVFANDCGSEFDAVSNGAGDWYEAHYWLREIRRFCERRGWTCLFVAAPFEYPMLNRRNSGNYPGKLVNLMEIPSKSFLNPIERFLNVHLRDRVAALREGREPSEGSVLFNWAIKDSHFSPVGAKVWAEAVGERLGLLLEEARLARLPRPGRPAGPPPGASATRQAGSR